jgi:hypothetical protein
VRIGAVIAEVPARQAADLTHGQPAWATFALADAHALTHR